MSMTSFFFRNAVYFRSVHELKVRVIERTDPTEDIEETISEQPQDPPRPPYQYCFNNMSATVLQTEKRCHHSGRNTLQKHKNKYI